MRSLPEPDPTLGAAITARIWQLFTVSLVALLVLTTLLLLELQRRATIKTNPTVFQ